MIALILTLAVVGVLLYLIEQLPMDAAIRITIRVIVLICVVVFIMRMFGVLDMPVPKLR